jgi:CheY-like chemotaxis protein
VLVVGDSAEARADVAEALAEGGYEALLAADGDEAIDLLREGDLPRLILLDAALPDRDGYALCRLLRHNPDTAHVKIVLLPDHDGPVVRARARLAGATECLVKPFDREELLGLADRLCGPSD